VTLDDMIDAVEYGLAFGSLVKLRPSALLILRDAVTTHRAGKPISDDAWPTLRIVCSAMATDAVNVLRGTHDA
jgi:hypothetical protein